ncbi:MAG: site-2 protease family protein [Limisphaerales bacterium]
MLPSRSGSIHLFKFQGIDVFLHWSWFLIAIFQISYRAGRYTSSLWCVFEYLALFVIVLLHEFGHALACRSVGGRADQIVLWPLGGVAYVDPPQRPGATLWSIAAGPLVNALLFPILSVVCVLGRQQQWADTMPNFYEFITTLWLINVVLFLFNMLPIYPLDGGQVLRSILWFMVGRARSLLIASTIGLVTVAVLLLFAIKTLWLGIMAVFALLQCWSGLQQARMLSRLDAAPRRAGAACPACHTSPPVGNFWVCGYCRRPFDMFATQGVCPHCGIIFNGTRCMQCGAEHPLYAFRQE